jgi:hypothetical protein
VEEGGGMSTVLIETGESTTTEVKVSIAYTCDPETENILKGFPSTWTVYNAPRPLYGTTCIQGKFLDGIFWAFINPADDFADRWRVENIRLAAALVKFVPMSEAKRVVQASIVAQGYTVDEFDWMEDRDYWREYVALMPSCETHTIPV